MARKIREDRWRRHNSEVGDVRGLGKGLQVRVFEASGDWV